MAAQEMFFDKANDVWTDQMNRWMDSMNLYRGQVEKLTNLWLDQSLEAQKEGQKFMKEWMASLSKSSVDCWKAWEASSKEATQMFMPETAKKGKA